MARNQRVGCSWSKILHFRWRISKKGAIKRKRLTIHNGKLNNPINLEAKAVEFSRFKWRAGFKNDKPDKHFLTKAVSLPNSSTFEPESPLSEREHHEENGRPGNKHNDFSVAITRAYSRQFLQYDCRSVESTQSFQFEY